MNFSTSRGLLYLSLHLLALPALASQATTEPDDDPFFEEWLRGEDLDDLSNLDVAEREIPGLAEILPPPPLWEVETTFSAGTGYRDNVRRSAVDKEGGGFLFGGFETMFLRFDEPVQFFAVLNAEHREFVFDRGLPSDTFLSAIAHAGTAFTETITGAVLLRSFYLDQVVDVATLDRPGEPPQRVRGQGVVLTPSLRRTWPANWFVEIAAHGSRQSFRAPLFDYWETGPKVSTGWSGENSELVFSTEYIWRDYDNRPALALDGTAIENEKVNFRIVRPEASFRHTWGDTRWHSRSRAGFEFNRDDATGFFDYDRLRLGQRIGFRTEHWEIEGRVEYSRYHYARQFAQGGARLWRNWWETGVEVRRNLAETLDIFARYDREEITSNDRQGDYSVNTWTIGFGVKF